MAYGCCIKGRGSARGEVLLEEPPKMLTQIDGNVGWKNGAVSAVIDVGREEQTPPVRVKAFQSSYLTQEIVFIEAVVRASLYLDSNDLARGVGECEVGVDLIGLTVYADGCGGEVEEFFKYPP